MTESDAPGAAESPPRPRGGVPMGIWSGSDATDRLRNTIIELNKATERQTRTIVRLTWALVVLTLVIAIATILLLTRGV
jgi:hypothetical protein